VQAYFAPRVHCKRPLAVPFQQQLTKTKKVQRHYLQSLRYSLYPTSHFKIAFMSSRSRGVKCTVHPDGSMWMHLDMKVPSHLLKESKVLTDALMSEADPSFARDFTLAAPKEWIQAWMVCCCSDEQRLSCADTKDLVNCLMVCCYFWVVASSALNFYIVSLCRTCAQMLIANRVLNSALSCNCIASV
jgi:hypothetical protein